MFMIRMLRTRGRDGIVADQANDRADARARTDAEEAGVGVYCRGGVDDEGVPRVEEQVPVVDEEVARVEEQVTVADESVAEERVVHDTDTITYASTEPSVHTDEAFPGGPSDRSVLTGYDDHVAPRIWQSEERPVLKVTSHGSKLKNFPERPMPEEVARIVQEFHLLDFAGCSLTMLDAPLLSAFVERWDQATTVHMVMDALEVDELAVLKEFGDTRGFHPKMSWLRKVYQELVDAGRYQDAARAYMLHLVACTLFADKSAYYLDVCHLTLFSDLDTSCWAWGVAVLTILYTTLDAASRLDTKQLAGYLSLLQCWIYEHFPHICERRTHRCATGDPCAISGRPDRPFQERHP
ncbi:protein MAIN-LIKE 2-like [Vicia villosa]|uniref:protein MAIN-LIKE 2-like n=1 Tax=Vicia villosa TaxID=3911 RepID=UPI00273C2096|nr:protein MAIN-LIKE 2-like [Vicia villosa]